MISRPENTVDVKSAPSPATSKCIDWFSEGEAKVVEVDGVRITVRFIGRKGRRARIAIVAPAGAQFTSSTCDVLHEK